MRACTECVLQEHVHLCKKEEVMLRGCIRFAKLQIIVAKKLSRAPSSQLELVAACMPTYFLAEEWSQVSGFAGSIPQQSWSLWFHTQPILASQQDLYIIELVDPK